MKRRSFLQLLAGALGLGAIARRAPAAAEVSARPALTSAVLKDIHAQLNNPDALRQAQEAGAAAGRYCAEYGYVDGYGRPFVFTRNPRTGKWEPDETAELLYGPMLKNMAKPRLPRPPQPNRRHGR